MNTPDTGIHIGLHYGLISGRMRKVFRVEGNSKVRTHVGRGIAAAISFYGLYALIKRKFISYITLQIHFVFFDYEEPVIFYELDLLAIMISTMVVAGLTACGNSAKEGNSIKSEAAQDTETATSKSLVVYYSATGNTKAVAEVIARQTSGDLFELVPSKQYTSGDLDWADYDTIYIIGYPIWWGIAAWPVDTFVKANDFSALRAPRCLRIFPHYVLLDAYGFFRTTCS